MGRIGTGPNDGYGRTARLFLAAVSISCFAVGCNKTFCNGTIVCSQFSLDRCSSVPGCMPGPACDIRTGQQQPCTAGTDQATCLGPMCTWLDDACLPFCRTLTVDTTCNAYHSNEKGPYGDPVWTCGWVQCLGKPDRSCENYSVETCPADLGCRVETSNGFPDN